MKMEMEMRKWCIYSYTRPSPRSYAWDEMARMHEYEVGTYMATSSLIV